MILPSPSASTSTPSARFAGETTSGLKARAWVEEVIGRRLPEGDFAAGFKDGVGLCELVNCFKPGAIPKAKINSTSTSPFHQMANISCFLKAVRALGVREQVLFETLVSFVERQTAKTRRGFLFPRVQVSLEDQRGLVDVGRCVEDFSTLLPIGYIAALAVFRGREPPLSLHFAMVGVSFR